MRDPLKYLLPISFFVLSIPLLGQDWKGKLEAGYKNWSSGELSLAFTLFDESIKSLPKGSKNYYETLFEITRLYAERGLFDRAEIYFPELLQYFRHDSVKAFSNIKTVALYYQTAGKLAQAEKLYEEIETYYEGDINNQYYPNISFLELTHEFIILYFNQGLYDKALLKAKGMVDRLDRYEFKGEKDSPSFHNCQLSISLAKVYSAQKKYTLAEQILKTKISRLERYGDRYNFLPVLYESYIDVCIELGQPDQAIGYYDKLINASKRAYKERSIDFPNYAGSVFVKGEFLSNRDYKKGKLLIERALSIYEDGLSKIHPDYQLDFADQQASLLLGAGNIFLNHGEVERGYNLIKRADSLALAKYGINSTAVVFFHNSNAAALLKQNKVDEAVFLLKEASQILIRNAEQNFSSLSEQERGRFYFEKIARNFDHYNRMGVSLLSKKNDVAGWLYNNRLATKGILFQSTEKVRRRIIESNDVDLTKTFDVWRAKKNLLASLYQQQEAQVEIDSLNNEINLLERTLTQNEIVADAFADHKQVEWKDIQKTLENGSAAVEIIRMGNINQTDSIYYLALCIRPGTDTPEYVLMKNGLDLESKYLKYYRNAIQNKIPDRLSYDQFWKPLASYFELHNIKSVFLSLDGVYNLISLESLLHPVQDRFVMDEINIHLVTNTKKLLQKSTAISNNTICLIGHPNYSGAEQMSTPSEGFNSIVPKLVASTTQRFFSSGKVSELPGTKVEVDEVSRMMKGAHWQTEKFTEDQASEETIKKITNPGILHIATHGYFTSLSSEPNDSFSLKSNPLLRSGVLLARCESTLNEKIANGEDGILTAYEAMNLTLDQTQLVVLSACETGLGEVQNGEGVYGLQRAFQQAGAHQILMALWKVSDEATQALMIEFYKNLAQGNSTQNAFTLAKMHIKNTFNDPFYWSAFVLIE